MPNVPAPARVPFRPMPSQKEVRARQNRQKERIAELHAEQRRRQARRRRYGGLAGVIGLVIVVGIGLAVGTNDSSQKVVAPPTAAPTTTTVLTSVKGKPCVGLKDPLPKGSPAMPLKAGPAPTKLATQDLKVGTGAVVPKGATVTVNYVGVACSTGKIFDSSYSGNQPFQAKLVAGSIIPGWQQGVPGMRIGGVRLLSIPSALAYGPSGKSGIAPDEALYFLVAPVKLG
jgi:peptidylprolyl isomerase